MATVFAVAPAVRILLKRIEPASIATVPDPLGVVIAVPLVELLSPTALKILAPRGLTNGRIDPRHLGKLIGFRFSEGSDLSSFIFRCRSRPGFYRLPSRLTGVESQSGSRSRPGPLAARRTGCRR